MKRTKTAFRQMAAMAKSRLANGFWDTQHNKSDLININLPNSEEEIFYRKVVGIIEQGSENPLTMVLDQDYMSTLDDASRQRYVLSTSNLVNKSIARYNKVS